jgi:hypothetical protein
MLCQFILSYSLFINGYWYKRTKYLDEYGTLLLLPRLIEREARDIQVTRYPEPFDCEFGPIQSHT